MKYFLLQIWILPLVRGILSLPQDNQLDFYHKNYRKSWQNHILSKKQDSLERRKFSSDFSSSNHMQKRLVNIEQLSSVIKDAQNTLRANKSMQIIDLAHPPTVPVVDCHQNPIKPPGETFNKVVCQQVPGRIICQTGKITFVINNGDHHMDNNVIERFIVMANQRYGEGDDHFDVSVDDKETTLCPCYAEETKPTTCEPDKWNKDEVPVVVECTLVSNENLKMCNPYYDPSEKIYQCKAKKIGIKKRSILHIVVHKNDTVSHVQDPILFRREVSSKGELDQPGLYEAVVLKNKKIEPRDLREDDISGLYYHTLAEPFVRNYTDSCTQECVSAIHGIEPSAVCKITKLATFNTTRRPCRDVSINKIMNTEKKNKTEPVTICTEETTTDDAFLISTKPILFRRRVSNKEELDRPELHETVLLKNKKIKPRDLRDDDISGLYYHTLAAPYVRNYTDSCTEECVSSLCGGQECNAVCKITKLATFNTTRRPCRDVSLNKIMNIEKKNKTEPVTICTEEVTTNDAFLISTNTAFVRKRRHRIRWPRGRLFQKPLKTGKKNERQLSGNIGINRSSNTIRRSKRQNFLLEKIKPTTYALKVAVFTPTNYRVFRTTQYCSAASNCIPCCAHSPPPQITNSGYYPPSEHSTGPEYPIHPEHSTHTASVHSRTENYTHAPNYVHPSSSVQSPASCLQQIFCVQPAYLPPPATTINRQYSPIFPENQALGTPEPEAKSRNTVWTPQKNKTKHHTDKLRHALHSESDAKISRKGSDRKQITSQPEPKPVFQKKELLNLQNLLDHVVKQSEIKYGQTPSFGQSKQQSYFLTDELKRSEKDLRTNIEHRNSRNTEKFLSDISQSIKNHTRRKRKLPSLQKNFNIKIPKS